MTTEQKRFTVITNKEFVNHNEERHRTYQTNPLKEKLMKLLKMEQFKYLNKVELI